MERKGLGTPVTRTDIVVMVKGRSYTYHEGRDGQKKLFAREQEIIGKYPNCGGQVAKGKFGALLRYRYRRTPL